MSNSEATILAAVIVAGLFVAWFIWRMLGPSRSAGYFQENQDDYTFNAEPMETTSNRSEDEHLEAMHPTGEYEQVGWYHVIEGKQLFKRLEDEGIDFYVESPHMDPAAGDPFTASHGGHGHNIQMMLHVHRDHLEQFDAIQATMYRHETEAGDETSLLEAFRSFGVSHDLDSTVEKREGRARAESDSQH